jgi:hypothetical protein
MSQYGRRSVDRGLMASVVGLALGLSGPCAAEEIAAFRLTGYEGYVSLGYLSDSQSQGTSGGAANTYSIKNMQEELFINTHSYFYHPNFLKMDLGGGPLLVQNEVEADGVSRDDHEPLYNLTGRLSFLEQKPYPLALYYDHLNPTVSTSLTQSFVQTNTKYGATFSLREPLSPVLVTTDAFRLRSEGSSATWVVDDNLEQASIRMSTALGQDGYGQLLYQANRQDSLSGNPALTIVPTAIENHTASFDSRVLFGGQRQLTLTNVLSYNTLSYVRPDFTLEREDFHFTPDLRWQHSDRLTSFYSYNLYKSREAALDATNQSVRTGLIHRDADRLSVTADLHGEDNRLTGLRLRSYGAGAQASYTRPWTAATLRLSAGAVYDQKDREAAAALISVIGERIQLVDGIPVTLAQEFIDTTTIRVFNLSRTQEYCPDVLPLPPGCSVADYRIVVIGARTQIQRLATGNILDGQEVLVDYAFQTGGTAGYSVFNQNYQVSLTLYRYYTVYVRHQDIDYNLTSGTPLLPLNSLRNTLYGLRFDQPFLPGTMLGGEAMFERQDEVIAPYRRESYDAYLQLPPLFSVDARLSGRRVMTDYFNSPEDVNLTGWALQLRASPWAYTTLSAEAAYEEDSGGTLRRALLRDTLGAEWRLRQLAVRGEAQYTREEQGSFERERTVIRISARRDL